MADPQAPYCRLAGQIVTPAGGIPRLKLYARPIITQGVAKDGVSPTDVQFATDDQGNIVPLDGAAVDVVAPGPGVNAPDRFQYQVLVYGPGLIETGYLRAEQGKTIDLNTVLPGAPYDGGLLASRVHRPNTGGGGGNVDLSNYPTRAEVAAAYGSKADVATAKSQAADALQKATAAGQPKDTGWREIPTGLAGAGVFQYRVMYGMVYVRRKSGDGWLIGGGPGQINTNVNLVKLPDSVKVKSRTAFPFPLSNNKTDGSIIEVWPNNTVSCYATATGDRIYPTVCAPVDNPAGPF